MSTTDFLIACIIPTGVGASIGGFAGDASPYVNLLSKVCPVITNTNAVNAACFSGINDNVLYTEGWALDAFFRGEIAFRPHKYNKIGVIFDKAIPESVLNVHINTINAVKSTYGINIIGYDTVDKADELIKKGAEALAAVYYFETPDNDDEYALHGGVDPIGKREAEISHELTQKYMIPVAHSPAFPESELLISSKIVDKRAAAEYITPTFLPCVLLGLYNAPHLIDIKQAKDSDVTVNSVKAVIMPCNCLDSPPVWAAIDKNIPVMAVEENKTVLNATAEALGIEEHVIKVKTYYEAAGRVLALKNGIFV
ncbi:MAG: hypothetical protein A2Y25_03405 [Candidatus Melainabacteria bacterium GWF2_37_15]|nr:MAG: hypothetical protein A2Y25_03405 [Candidatus Melainabacteria bacterium GWF2_37_15]